LLQPPSSGLRSSDLTYTDAYTSILRRVRRSPNSSAGGIVVFVGTDLDGLLASKILACLFRQDDVPYRLIPVGGYEELDRRKTEVAESGEVYSTDLQY
jgi:cell division control protein 45